MHIRYFNSLFVSVVVIAITIFPATGVFAQKSSVSQDEQDEEAKLPKSGVLSQSLSGGTGDAKIAMPWGDQKNPQGTEAPITGSVSRQSQDQWVMRIINGSENTYSVSLKVVQYDSRGTQVKSDSFSYRLKGSQKEERSIPSGLGAVDAKLVLQSWKNLTPKKKEDEADKTAAQGAGGNQANRTR